MLIFGVKIMTLMKFCPSIKHHGGMIPFYSVAFCYKYHTHVLFHNDCRYVFCHMAGKCRRQAILQYFEEDNDSADHSGVCCDVCDKYKMIDFQEYKEEITVILKVVQEIPEKGETKVLYTILKGF